MKIPNILVLMLMLGGASAYAANSIDEPLAIQKEMDSSGATSQKKIDEVSQKTVSAVQEYRNELQRAVSLDVYNQQLARLVESQRNEMESLTKQIGEIDNIELGVLPLMLKMISTLEQVISADVPFLLKERQARVENLKGLIDRADISVGEKFRRIMEAYVIETDYGRTIEAYQSELLIGGEPLTVDMLRFGRVGLYYQTLDGNTTGRWNANKQAWETLGSDYRRSVLDGLRIARKQAPPEMLKLAVDAPGEK
ncbi:DUF3450 domain-containing protein [Methylophaga sp.]|uniref:DUF3450 domain-containing protein n=1 Tax=Methylophaga sp. TaxID=2024840 RepID=UPI00271B2B48|nr:DUF3450 domain-containing protein [Methylophaga sp.]MDO8826887.1 DUF3450 domain-containing protein [Methylophaga sp.]